MENGEGKTENGEGKMENGKRKVESRKWRKGRETEHQEYK